MTFAIGSLPTMSSVDFESYWQLLDNAMTTLLRLPPGNYPPISYEQTYSAVYKCVCNGFAEELYNKVMRTVVGELERSSKQLKALSNTEYLDTFHTVYVQYTNGLSCIVPIFNYLARFYVEAKLSLSLKDELSKLFVEKLLDPNLEDLLRLLTNNQHYSPSNMETLVKMIYSFKPDVAAHYSALFQKFIPGLISVTQDQLPALRAEVIEMMKSVEDEARIDDAQVQPSNPHARDGDQGRGIKRESFDSDDQQCGEAKHFKQ